MKLIEILQRTLSTYFKILYPKLINIMARLPAFKYLMFLFVFLSVGLVYQPQKGLQTKCFQYPQWVPPFIVTQENCIELQTEYFEHKGDIELTCPSIPKTDENKILHHIWYSANLDSSRMLDYSSDSTTRFKVVKEVKFVVAYPSYYLDDENSKTIVKTFDFNTKATVESNDQKENKMDGKKHQEEINYDHDEEFGGKDRKSRSKENRTRKVMNIVILGLHAIILSLLIVMVFLSLLCSTTADSDDI